MYYLCEKYYKPITVQYYIVSCVSWVPRLTLLDLRTNWTYTCPQNRIHLYVGDLLFWKTRWDVCVCVCVCLCVSVCVCVCLCVSVSLGPTLGLPPSWYHLIKQYRAWPLVQVTGTITSWYLFFKILQDYKSHIESSKEIGRPLKENAGWPQEWVY